MKNDEKRTWETPEIVDLDINKTETGVLTSSTELLANIYKS